jgi:hypothetical protein
MRVHGSKPTSASNQTRRAGGLCESRYYEAIQSQALDQNKADRTSATST